MILLGLFSEWEAIR